MGYDRAAPKRAVNMSLNEELVTRARAITPNLSATVEQLLAAFIDDAEARATERDRQIAEHIKANNAFVAKYGSWAKDFNTL